MSETSEFMVPGSPPDNEGYTSGNPSQYQYASAHLDDSDDLDYHDSPDDPFIDGFPSQLTKALLPLTQGDDAGPTKSVADEAWLNYNDDEIQLMDSMRDKADQDLGAQLVNAHGLKTTRYDYEKLKTGEVKNYHNKRRWQREVPDGEEDRKAFETDDMWAAWPLQPWLVPRIGEEEELASRRWSASVRPWMRAGTVYKPREELGEHLVAATQRMAKERFEKRKWKKVDDGQSSEEEDEAAVARELGVVVDEEEVERRRREREEDGGEKGKTAQEMLMEGVEEDVERRAYRRYRDRREPVVDVDDERVAKMMKPVVGHVLARLDDLLLALRKNRRAVEADPDALKRRQSQAGSASGSVSGGDSARHDPASGSESQGVKREPRSRGRPKRRKLREIPAYEQESQFVMQRVPGRKGRPKKVFLPRPGETEREMLIRVAKEQHKPVPQFDDDSDVGVGRNPKYRRGRKDGGNDGHDGYHGSNRGGDGDGEDHSAEAGAEQAEDENAARDSQPTNFTPLTQSQLKNSSDSDSDALHRAYDNWPRPSESWPDRKARKLATQAAKDAAQRERELKYANRDWSDVVGVAALIGFPERVLKRTVSRMSGLVGESMECRVFRRLPKGEVETLVKFSPDETPLDDGLSAESEEESGDGEEDESGDEMDTDSSDNEPSRKSTSTLSRTSKPNPQPTVPVNQDSDNEVSCGSSASSSCSSDDEAGYTCPVESCERYHKGREMSTAKALRAHLRKRHGYSEAEIEGLGDVESSEGEMWGGVHRDGWLERVRGRVWYDGRRAREQGEGEMEMEMGSLDGSDEEEEEEEEEL